MYGLGLDPKFAARLFEAFSTTKPEGMGMGLAICRSIIEAHGGRLWARANQPQGAVFQFMLARRTRRQRARDADAEGRPALSSLRRWQPSLISQSARMTHSFSSSARVLSRRGWELKRDDEGVELALKGDWIARESGARPLAEVDALAVSSSDAERCASRPVSSGGGKRPNPVHNPIGGAVRRQAPGRLSLDLAEVPGKGGAPFARARRDRGRL